MVGQSIAGELITHRAVSETDCLSPRYRGGASDHREDAHSTRRRPPSDLRRHGFYFGACSLMTYTARPSSSSRMKSHETSSGGWEHFLASSVDGTPAFGNFDFSHRQYWRVAMNCRTRVAFVSAEQFSANTSAYI